MTSRDVPGRPGRPRGPRPGRDQRRAELLDAAERAVRRVGPAASMDEIAAEAGVTKPILYAHFGDKAGLIRAMAGRVAGRLDAAVGAALAQPGDARAVVASTIEAFCTFVERETDLYRFLVQTARHSTGRSGSRLMTEIANRIAASLGGGLRRAGADPAAAEPWAYAILGMTFTGAGWWLERRSMAKEDLVDHLTRLVWSGLAGAGLDRVGLGRDGPCGGATGAPGGTPRARPPVTTAADPPAWRD